MIPTVKDLGAINKLFNKSISILISKKKIIIRQTSVVHFRVISDR